MKLILGLAGQIACGKGSVSKYLQKKYQANCYVFSRPLRDILKLLDLADTRENIAKISQFLRDNFGQDLLVKVLIKNVLTDKNKIIIVDGIRRSEELPALKKLADFKLLYLDVPPKLRYERLKNRRDKADDKNKTYAQFLADEKLESEAEIKALKQKADFIIENKGSLEELYKKIDKIICL